jgi:hypothetical protein
MLKYSGLRSAADAMFGTFVLAWLVTRQFGLLLVIVSVWEDAGRLMPIDTPEEVEIGPYDLVRLSRPRQLQGLPLTPRYRRRRPRPRQSSTLRAACGTFFSSS